MKLNKYIITGLAVTALAASSCSDFEEIKPAGGTLVAAQVQETSAAITERATAAFGALYTQIGLPCSVFGTSQDRPDDWGILQAHFSNDLEGPDAWIPDINYNWFSACGQYTSRTPSYANPYVRYAAPYNLIAAVNDFVVQFPEDAEGEVKYMVAQAYALRAFAYWILVNDFQFGPTVAGDKPAVPIVTPQTIDTANNPRATVNEVYELMIGDLTYAIENLDGYERPNASYINVQAAKALRARLYLAQGEWQKAYDDAVAAADGFSPATIAEVSVPTFKDISEHNWIWGYDMTTENASIEPMATNSSWLRSFSGNAYAAAVDCYTRINSMLYNKIPDTDVRKGWWLDTKAYSPLLNTLTWDSASGQDIVGLEIEDTKVAMTPYVNVKFGCNSCGTILNDEDTPLVRVEEMILVQVECLAHLNKTDEAKTLLTNFVKTYRDPSYTIPSEDVRSFENEIWFQRRVELWGEGLSRYDLRRLDKPMVRFRNDASSTNFPAKFRFNMKHDDGYALMRFSQYETNTNFGIVDNEDGKLPEVDQNPELTDGVN